ncbi:ankyrin repeat protein [Xylaria sp. FL0064]|nr:ankyrin repeat protein [Xylaria sp. FL0064]
MASRDDYTMAAAKAMLDRIYPDLPADSSMNDTNAYILGSLNVGVYGTTSAATVATQMLASIGGGMPGTKEDIRLGDVYDFGKRCAQDQIITTGALNKPSTMLLAAAGKIPDHISKIMQNDLSSIFTHPGLEEDVLFEPNYEHVTESVDNACNYCDPNRVILHYGLIASGNQHGILCFEMEAAGLMDIAQCLVIRGISDYADSHKLKRWQGYAAAAAAAYAKEILSLIPPTRKPDSLASVTDLAVATVLDALLLTRPEGRRVDGTCEWLIRHPSYEDWLQGTDPTLLWISGGPGKGKTMLAIYITEELQPVVDSCHGVLLYYFCSNRDKNRNTALTIMRGVLHQWLSFHPHLAQYVRSYFDGAETTKYTISSFICLWRLFLIMLLLDGRDECEDDSLRQLLDVLREFFLESEEKPKACLKVILLSRPQAGLLEGGLRPFPRIRLDDADTEVGKDVEKYISAKVAELASEQILSAERLQQVRKALMTHADGTFLWVGFVANELKGRSWLKANDILRGVPKGLGGIYQRLVPILQWVVLAARPMTVDELAVAADIKASDALTPAEVLRDRLASCGLLIKIGGDVVNLVHESAREFFQSDQVNTDGIKGFHMNRTAHRTLMRTCLGLIEGSYKSPGSISSASLHNTLLTYASIYWPEHFRHAFNQAEAQSEFSRQFFQAESAVREDWWSFYWQREQAGGAPPSFTLLHLAAYFGNVAWAKMLLEHNASNGIPLRRYTSRKDSFGRTPLFWAATRGHRDVVELLLDHGANINSKDRGKMTALHVAVTGEHKDVVSLLLDRSARIEDKAYYGETPLMRAIQANSKDIVKLLLEHGARVDGLPTPPGGASLRGLNDPLQERAKQLLELQEQLFAARYENQSRQVDIAIKIFTFSLRFRPIFKLVALYIRHLSLGRWEVLQDLVKNNETEKLRDWARSFTKFGNQLIEARNPRDLAAMTGLSVRVFEVVSSADLEALLVIGVMVGSGVMLTAAQHRWRDGVEISGRTFSQFASLAYRSGCEKSLDYGVRQFLNDFDTCIQEGRRAESVGRVVVLFSTHLAILASEDPWPIEYFSSVIREYFESYVGGRYEEQLFNDASQACANELSSISERRDSRRLFLMLSALLQIAHSSRRGHDGFFNLPPAACLILCQDSPKDHGWLIGEGIPVVMSGLIPRHLKGQSQKQGLKALVECLIYGKQYGLSLPAAVQEMIRKNLNSIDGVEEMLNHVLNP